MEVHAGVEVLLFGKSKVGISFRMISELYANLGQCMQPTPRE